MRGLEGPTRGSLAHLLTLDSRVYWNLAFAIRGRLGSRPPGSTSSAGDAHGSRGARPGRVVRRRLPLEHTDIEIHEIESSRQITATSCPVACECKKVTTPSGCIPRSTVGGITP
jgi:hypothetical protein